MNVGHFIHTVTLRKKDESDGDVFLPIFKHILGRRRSCYGWASPSGTVRVDPTKWIPERFHGVMTVE